MLAGVPFVQFYNMDVSKAPLCRNVHSVAVNSVLEDGLCVGC